VPRDVELEQVQRISEKWSIVWTSLKPIVLLDMLFLMVESKNDSATFTLCPNIFV
jgi:hypothetical protein